MGNYNVAEGSRERTETRVNENLNERLLRRLFSTTATAVLHTGSHNRLAPCKNNFGECNICLTTTENLLQTTGCLHKACAKCWLRFFCAAIEVFAMARLNCIECKEGLNPSAVVNLLDGAIRNRESVGIEQNAEDALNFPPDGLRIIFLRFEEFLLQRSLFHEPDVRWCPKGCGYGLIGYGFSDCPRLVCEHPDCNGSEFCYNCQRPWLSKETADSSTESAPDHVCSAKDAAAGRINAVESILVRMGLRRMPNRLPITPKPITKYSFFRGISTDSADGEELTFKETDVEMNAAVRQIYEGIEIEGVVKPCPRCGAIIMKNEGCNHMSCSQCGYEFCWLCLAPHTTFHSLGCYSGLRGRLPWYIRLSILIGSFLLAPIVIALVGILSPVIGMVGMAYASSATMNRCKIANRHAERFVTCSCYLSYMFILGPYIGVMAFAVLLIPALLFVYIHLPVTFIQSLLTTADRVEFIDHKREDNVQLEQSIKLIE